MTKEEKEAFAFANGCTERQVAEEHLKDRSGYNARHRWIEWSSPLDFCKLNGPYGSGHERAGTDHWMFGDYGSIAEAREAIAMGKPHQALFDEYVAMRDKLQPLIERLAVATPNVKRKRRYADEGDEVDLNRALYGDPDCFYRWKRAGKKQTVRLGIQFSFSGATHHGVFTRVVAMGCALSDLLETLGYAVEIVGVSPNSSGSNQVVNTVVVKSAATPLDVNNVLVMGIPAFERVFEFDAMALFGFHPSMNSAMWHDWMVPGVELDAMIGAKVAVPGQGEVSTMLKGVVSEIETIINR